MQLIANSRECVGAIIEEDEDIEGDERFDVVVLDSNTGIELNRIAVTLFDEEGKLL